MSHVLLGIGNELKGDDGIGNILAKGYREEGWISIACETVPENFAGVVERERPETLVIVDAADMGIGPGDIRIIPTGRIGSSGFGTHGMPLSHLVSRLRASAGEIIFIGVQPANVEMGSSISPQVEMSRKTLISALKNRDWESIDKI